MPARAPRSAARCAAGVSHDPLPFGRTNYLMAAGVILAVIGFVLRTGDISLAPLLVAATAA
jgi:hypothetical protein